MVFSLLLPPVFDATMVTRRGRRLWTFSNDFSVRKKVLGLRLCRDAIKVSQRYRLVDSRTMFYAVPSDGASSIRALLDG
jgi:hypothetical protein